MIPQVLDGFIRSPLPGITYKLLIFRGRRSYRPGPLVPGKLKACVNWLVWFKRLIRLWTRQQAPMHQMHQTPDIVSVMCIQVESHQYGIIPLFMALVWNNILSVGKTGQVDFFHISIWNGIHIGCGTWLVRTQRLAAGRLNAKMSTTN
jgi:hypothetical protein